MIMLDRAIPALMGSLQIKQKTGGVIGVLYRVQHIRQLEKPVHVPFGVHLHTACINTVITSRNCRLKIINRSLFCIEEQACSSIQNRLRLIIFRRQFLLVITVLMQAVCR